MRAEKKSARCEGVRLSIKRNGKEVARAYLFLMWNSLHERPLDFWKMSTLMKSVRGFGSGYGDRKCRGYRGERARMLQAGRNKSICETGFMSFMCVSVQGSRKRVQDRPLEFRAPPASALLTNHFVEGHTDAQGITIDVTDIVDDKVRQTNSRIPSAVQR